MRYPTGAVLVLMGFVAPAFAQGPMTPTHLSDTPPQQEVITATKTSAVPPQAVSAPAPTDSPIVAQSVMPPRKSPIVLSRKQKKVDVDTFVDTSAIDASLPQEPPRTRAAIDPDHMADALNRMQLDGGYGASDPSEVGSPVPLFSDGN